MTKQASIPQRKEEAMFLPNTQIFKDIRREAIDEISEIAVEERHEIGSVLFFAGEPAVNFYILVEGVVGLAIGEEATSHYTVDKIGESFGWSSLVGRPSYSAKAECFGADYRIEDRQCRP